MDSVGMAARHDAPALPITADEEVARGCAARLLISAATERAVETLARRIHESGPRAQSPFLHLWARDFPVEPQALREYCGRVLDRTAGGSVLIDAVEETPPSVQDALIDVLDGRELTRRPSAAVRPISGTTVSLLDRVAAGTFSAQLFYRLNVIHLVAPTGPLHVTGPDDFQDVRLDDPTTPPKLPR
jgi:two-component system C4-dicarboxylate transport response regulator DctD